MFFVIILLYQVAVTLAVIKHKLIPFLNSIRYSYTYKILLSDFSVLSLHQNSPLHMQPVLDKGKVRIMQTSFVHSFWIFIQSSIYQR